MNCFILIVGLRFLTYGSVFYKTHVYANKITGESISSLLYHSFGLLVIWFIILIAFVCTLEEFITILKSKQIDRDCQSNFKGGQNEKT